MNYHLESELSTILYNIESQHVKLDLFLAKNKQELIELNIYDNINNGFLTISTGLSEINEVF